jgi:copper chaperone CopZ
MKLLAIFLMIFSININLMGQVSENLDIIKIKTSSECTICKEKIEKALMNNKGIHSSNLNLRTKIVTVEYYKDKIKPDEIRQIISKTGYAADNIPADPTAYNNLPMCCKRRNLKR